MLLESWPIDQVKPCERNPRVNDGAVEAVAASITEYGMRQPLPGDTAGVIIVGHTRWKAAKKLGLTEVPVHVARDLEPEAVRAYRIADNKTAELADWDFDLLPIELQGLYFSQAIIWVQEHPVLTRKDIRGSRVEQVAFGWGGGLGLNQAKGGLIFARKNLLFGRACSDRPTLVGVGLS